MREVPEAASPSLITRMPSLFIPLPASCSLLPSLSPPSLSQVKVKEAYQRLYQKPANYQLPDEDVRQLLYDLESSYNVFLSALKSRS